MTYASQTYAPLRQDHTGQVATTEKCI